MTLRLPLLPAERPQALHDRAPLRLGRGRRELGLERVPGGAAGVSLGGNYEPGNCRWSTAQEQHRNTSKNRILTAFGESMPMVVWAERLGVRPGTIKERLRRGWSEERALSAPVRPYAHVVGGTGTAAAAGLHRGRIS